MNCHTCAKNDYNWDWDERAINTELYSVGFPTEFCSKECLNKYIRINDMDKSKVLKYQDIDLVDKEEGIKEFGEWDEEEVRSI